jgi:hypothetical protein
MSILPARIAAADFALQFLALNYSIVIDLMEDGGE